MTSGSSAPSISFPEPSNTRNAGISPSLRTELKNSRLDVTGTIELGILPAALAKPLAIHWREIRRGIERDRIMVQRTEETASRAFTSQIILQLMQCLGFWTSESWMARVDNPHEHITWFTHLTWLIKQCLQGLKQGLCNLHDGAISLTSFKIEDAPRSRIQLKPTGR